MKYSSKHIRINLDYTATYQNRVNEYALCDEVQKVYYVHLRLRGER